MVIFLGGGLKDVLCSSLLREKIQFEEHSFQLGWFNHQLVLVIYFRFFAVGAHESCKALHFPWNLLGNSMFSNLRFMVYVQKMPCWFIRA